MLNVRLGLPLSFHLAAVEAHGRMVAETKCKSNASLPSRFARVRTREWNAGSTQVKNCVGGSLTVGRFEWTVAIVDTAPRGVGIGQARTNKKPDMATRGIIYSAFRETAT